MSSLSGSDMDYEVYAHVALPGIPEVLTYGVPPELRENLVVGHLVEVPLRNKREKGVVVSLQAEHPSVEGIKAIFGIPDPEISVDEKLLELARWTSEYYLTPLGDVFRAFLPPKTLAGEKIMIRFRSDPERPLRGDRQRELLEFLRRRGRRWITLRGIEKELGRDYRDQVSALRRLGAIEVRVRAGRSAEKELSSIPGVDLSLPEVPTREQRAAMNRVIPFIEKGAFRPFLLHGVTGSGKTALYLWLVERALARGRGAIVLVPEIGLTPQIASVFIKRFGDNVVLYHSSFPPEERLWAWKALKRGERRVVIGPRSALFLPVRDPGIIVVDEEHDPSYKQHESAPFYNARDVAIMRGKIEGIPVVLGSATPSLESYFNARKGKYVLLELKKRIRGYRMPDVDVVDMREESSSSIISIRLAESMRRTLRKGGKVILFLNRRGFSPVLHCPDCGYVPKCPHCSVSLVYHRKERKLVCHLCGHTEDAPSLCPRCGSQRIKPLGFGTERVEEEVRRLFPEESYLRMDLDTTRRKGAVDRFYRRFLKGKEKIMIGTQMVTKGFDFPEVELVGVLNADVGLGLPDFRAEERTFQILTQVTGRIRKGGRCLIQTYSPEAPSVVFAVKGDYPSFYERELESRKEFCYPPFYRLAFVEIRSRDAGRAREIASRLHGEMLKIRNELRLSLDIEGPLIPPVEKVRGYFRRRLLLRSSRPLEIQNLLKKMEMPRRGDIRITVDVDPLDFL